MKQYSVYILTNYQNSIFYIGVTNSLLNRVWEHKHQIYQQSFTQKYCLYKLVYYEDYDSITNAINREKQLKNWHRQWKINLINSFNPYWQDLYQEWIKTLPPGN